jgi:osmotically-inducible protein OsmY
MFIIEGIPAIVWAFIWWRVVEDTPSNANWLTETEKQDVENALRISTIDDSDIHVDVTGSTVTLTGTVTSWYQKDEASKIAWKTPGIWHVNNELVVDYAYTFS